MTLVTIQTQLEYLYKEICIVRHVQFSILWPFNITTFVNTQNSYLISNYRHSILFHNSYHINILNSRIDEIILYYIHFILNSLPFNYQVTK